MTGDNSLVFLRRRFIRFKGANGELATIVVAHVVGWEWMRKESAARHVMFLRVYLSNDHVADVDVLESPGVEMSLRRHLGEPV